jgi:hypothetical protein
MRSLKTFVAVTLFAPALFAGKNDALSLVPADAVSVGVVQLSEIRNSPILGRLFDETDRMTVDGDAERFLRETGLRPSEDIDTMTAALLPAESLRGDGQPLVIFEGRFDAEKITASITKRGAQRVMFGGTSYLRLKDESGAGEGAIAVISSSLIVAGSEDTVKEAIVARSNGGTGFIQRGLIAGQIRHVDPSAHAWAIVDVTRAQRMADSPKWSEKQNDPRNVVASTMKSVETVVLWSRESSDELVLGAHTTARDEETSQAIEDLVRGALATWRLGVSERLPELVPVIRSFDVERDGRSIRFRGAVPGKLIREGAKRAQAHKQKSN